MEKKTTQRIVGISIVTALVIILLPFAFNNETHTQLASTEKPSTFPDQSIPPSVPQQQVAQQEQPAVPQQQSAQQPEQPGIQQPQAGAVESSNTTAQPINTPENNNTIVVSPETANTLNETQKPGETVLSLGSSVSPQTTPTTATDPNQTATAMPAQASTNNTAAPVATNTNTAATPASPYDVQQPVTNPAPAVTTNIPQATSAEPVTTPATTTTEPTLTSASNTFAAVVNTPSLTETVHKKEHHASHKKVAKMNKQDMSKLKNTAWVVRMGVFKNKQNATKLVNELRSEGYKAFTRDIGTTTHVYVGPEFRQASAASMVNKLQSAVKIQGMVMMYHPLEL